MNVIIYPIGYYVFYIIASLLEVWEDNIGYPFTPLTFTSYMEEPMLTYYSIYSIFVLWTKPS